MSRYLHRSATAMMIAGMLLSTVGSACAPRLSPLQGITPVNAVLPVLPLPPQYRQVVFEWEVEQASFVARGNGAVRLAPPDSARADLFLTGGFGGVSAILIGDSLYLPHGGTADLVPPMPLLWAALGRLALPALPDTVIRVSGDTTAADVGRPTQWRVIVVHDQLVRLDHVSNGRITESAERRANGEVRYASSNHRSLVLHIQRDIPMSAFDASIWHF